MQVDYSFGVWELNGTELGVPDYLTLTMTDGDDALNYYGPADPDYFSVLPRALGGLGNDSFYGDAFRALGGAGNDFFTNNGWNQYWDGPGYAYSYGQGGRDTFVDFYGSTQYFGGSGDDFFTNVDFLTHSFEGDHDIVSLGRGDDTAHWEFSFISGPDGILLEDRLGEISGDEGHDTLILTQINSGVVITRETSIDFRVMNEGTLALGNATFTDFEAVRMVFGSSTLNNVSLTAGDDYLTWFDMNGETFRPNIEGYDPDLVPTGPLVINGLGGNDYIVGSLHRSREVINGGSGDDIITGGGSSREGHRETLRGGNGDDYLFLGSVTLSPYYNATMAGGNGADAFVFNHFQTGATVTDFEVGIDTVVLDFGSLSLSDIDDLRLITQDDWNRLRVIRDDEDVLRFSFTVDRVDGFPSNDRYNVTYDRRDGSLYFQRQDDLFTEGLGEAVAVFENGADLTIDDFAFIDQTGYDLLV